MAPINTDQCSSPTDGHQRLQSSPWSAVMKGGINPFMGSSSSSTDPDISTTPILRRPTRKIPPTDHVFDHPAPLKRRRQKDTDKLDARKRRETMRHAEVAASPISPSNQFNGVAIRSVYPLAAHPGQDRPGSQSSLNGSAHGINTSPCSNISVFSPQTKLSSPQINLFTPQTSFSSPQTNSFAPQTSPQQLPVRLPVETYLRPDHVLRSPEDRAIFALLDAAPVYQPKGTKIPSSRKPGDFDGPVQALKAMRKPKIAQGPGGNHTRVQQGDNNPNQQMGPPRSQHKRSSAHGPPWSIGTANPITEQAFAQPPFTAQSTTPPESSQPTHSSSHGSQRGTHPGGFLG